MGRYQEKQALLTLVFFFFIRLQLFLEPKENRHVETLFNKHYGIGNRVFLSKIAFTFKAYEIGHFHLFNVSFL